MTFGPVDTNFPTNSDQNEFCIGAQPNHGPNTVAIDEIAIFNADLSPNETAVGQISPRFMEMYNMGIN